VSQMTERSRNRWRVLCAVVLMVAIGGCGDASSGSNESGATEEPPETPAAFRPAPSMDVHELPRPMDVSTPGVGIDLREFPPEVKSNVCVGMEWSIQNQISTSVSTIYAAARKGAARRLDLNTLGELSRLDLVDHYDDLHDGSRYETFRTTVIRMVMGRRSLRGDRDASAQNACDGETPPDWDRQEFRERCGTATVQSETFGGYLLVTHEVDELPNSAGDGVFDYSLSLAERTSESQGDASRRQAVVDEEMAGIHVTGYGLEPPQDSQLEDGEFSTAEAFAHVNRLEDAYVEAFEERKAFDPAYGAVLRREFRPYASHADYADCGVESYEPGACYNELEEQQYAAREERGEILSMKRDVERTLDFWDATESRHPGDEAYSQQKASLEYIDSCLEGVDRANVQACRSAFEEGSADRGSVCSACEVERGCDSVEQYCDPDFVGGAPCRAEMIRRNIRF